MPDYICIPKELIEFMGDYGFTSVEFEHSADADGNCRWCIIFENRSLGYKISFDMPIIEQVIADMGLAWWLSVTKANLYDHFKSLRGVTCFTEE